MVYIRDLSVLETTDLLEIILSEIVNAKKRGRKSNNYNWICNYLIREHNVGCGTHYNNRWNFESMNQIRIDFINTMCAGSIRAMFYDMISQ